MAKNKKYVEEVVNEPNVSETPSVLVAPAPEDKPNQLSPNPAHSGFVKQLFVDSLPESGEPNVIYCVAQKAGVEQAIVGYKNWKWDLEEKKFVRVYGSDPLLKLLEGQHGTLEQDNNPPKVAPEKIFVGEVVFVHEPTIEGKKLHEFIDLEGGVTHDELVAALQNYYTKNETYSKTQTDNLLGEKQDLLSGATTPEGTANKLVGLDSNGNLVQSPLPEGTVVVDEDLDENSTNPVENKAVAAKFNEVDESLEQKANVDGNYPTLTAGNADQLNSTVYVVDKVPYLYRTSGGDADIGNREYDKIIGGSLAVNQLVRNGKPETGSTYWFAYQGTLTFEDNSLHYTSETAYASLVATVAQGFIAGHKYLFDMEIKNNRDSTFRLQMFSNSYAMSEQQTIAVGSDFKKYSLMVVSATQNEGQANLYISNVDAVVDYNIKNVKVHDLTVMFGSTIADYIYALERANAGTGVAWFRNYFKKEYYPFNSGAIKNVKLVSHDMVGFNQWDEEWELGGYDSSTGQPTNFTNKIRSKNTNPIKVLPNTTYYSLVGNYAGNYMGIYCFDLNGDFISYTEPNATTHLFTTPSNCYFIKFDIYYGYGTTYNNDICINLSWSGWRNGQYEPYQKNSYPLDTAIELRGIPKLDSNNHLYFDGDEYSSDGKVVRKYGVVDLGTLNWEQSSQDSNRFYVYYSNAKGSLTNSAKGNLICIKYVNETQEDIVAQKIGIAISNTQNLFIYDTNYSDAATLKSSLDGVYLIYELVTPTEETATPFQEPQIVDDFGTEEYVVPTQDGWQVPVGHDTKYPANLRDKLQRLPDMPSVSQNVTETYVVNYNGTTKKCTFVDIAGWLGANGWVKLTDITGYDATRTQSLKNVNGTLTWITEGE